MNKKTIDDYAICPDCNCFATPYSYDDIIFDQNTGTMRLQCRCPECHSQLWLDIVFNYEITKAEIY